jgi:hypothetical protein
VSGREKADVSWPIARYSLVTTGTSLSARPLGVTARGELAGRAGDRAAAGAGPDGSARPTARRWGRQGGSDVSCPN